MNPADTSPEPVRLAIVCNSPSPYRIHEHRRLATELPGVEVWSLFAHEYNNQPWDVELPEVIRPVVLGPGEATGGKNRPANWLREWRKGGAVLRFIDEHRIDAVISTGFNDLCRLRFLPALKERGVPFFICGDSNIKGDRARGWRRLVKTIATRWVVRRAAGVMPCGVHGAAFFARYGATPDRTFFVPREPDYGAVEAARSATSRVRAEFGLDPDRPRIVFCGRFDPVKRIDLLIDAFATLAREREDLDLLIVGDGPLRDELHARVPGGVADRVTWTGFVSDPTTLYALYHASDVFCLPGTFEAWGVVVEEAVAAGCAPVLSDAVGAAPELCHEGVNGFTAPPGDLDALTDALRRVLEPGDLPRFKAASLEVMARWRRTTGDPVRGVHLALAQCGLLDPPEPVT